MTIDTPVAVGSVSIAGTLYPIYGSQTRAIEYHLGGLNGAVFTDADFTEQQRSLITARRMIDRQNLLLTKTGGDTQATGFPRGEGETTVPLGVEFAQYELATVLIADPEAFNTRTTGSNIRELQAGPVRLVNFSRTDGGSSAFSGQGVFPPQVLDLIKPYLGGTVSVIAPFAGGTGRKSAVLGTDQFGLNEPL